MTVSVTAARDAGLALGRPQLLFETPRYNLANSKAQYDVTPDGERFLMSLPARDQAPITVTLNWAAELKR